MAQNFFSLLLFLLESSLSMYVPFVTFVMLISTWTKKNPVTFVSYCKYAYFVSSSVITLYVFSIHYFHYTDFKMDQEKTCYFCFIF